MPARPCLRCKRLIASGSYCRACRPWPKSPGRLTGRRWQRIRQAVIAAHGARCNRCGAADIPLQIHHRNGDHRDNAMGNLEAVCPSCHAHAGRGQI